MGRFHLEWNINEKEVVLQAHSFVPELIQLVTGIWPTLVALTHIVVACVASGHAILYKRDSRAAVAWVGLIWFSPLFGALFYLLFGINRIRRKAQLLKGHEIGTDKVGKDEDSSTAACKELPSHDADYLSSLVHFVDEAVSQKLTKGNQVTPLKNGEQAYPAMLKAIDSAVNSVTLSTYIFDHDEAGKLFADALARAVERKVDVRVLVDAVGARYSWPPIIRTLKRKNILVTRFLPTVVPWYIPYMNLRNHRKILVVDGRIGFTGGMNIRQACFVEKYPKTATQDFHFRFEGPVVSQLQDTFVSDWAFATQEVLEGEKWFPSLEEKGTVLARGIPDGPGVNFETIRWTILGGISRAKSRIRIVTPYFVPDSTVLTSLNVAAMSGIKVELILPQKNNLTLVQWASMATIWQLLQRDCKIYLSHPPFDHSKIMLVDDCWVLVGSSNWDARSLRLNFEFNIECYDRDLSKQMNLVFDQKLAVSKELTLDRVDGRKLPIKLRDGVARLLTPYL